ncbi:hypothetical protein [Flavisolibacter tropicus]|uniref:hypothetical protein n=1 Tax=Flavisolibacter tropicus TaxID=1492898 RepID=UPI000B00F914|nr:hypothetical protein [Flavisolibacter tropicus]
MKRIKQWMFSLGTGSLMLMSVSGYSQVKKEDLKIAIKQSADYIANTVLDKEGKSKCDYNLTEGKWYDYEVPWHTGQAVYALLAAYKQTGNKAYLQAAKKGGDYWVGMEIKDQSVLKGMVAAKHGDVIGEDFIVFATVSDGTPGIYELSRVTKDQKYAKVATSAAAWMLNNMYYAEAGVCYDNIDAKTGEVLKEKSPFWKDKPNQKLFDVSRPNTEGWLFMDAYEFSGDNKFKEAYINLCNSLVEKQGKEGVWMQFMPNFIEEQSFHPRFSLWYAESLVKGYELTKDKRYLDAAANTARTFAKAQLKDGTIFYDNYLNGRQPDKGSATGSSVAFAGILWMQLSKYGYKEFEQNIERSAVWLMNNRYDVKHPDPNLRGAVLETRTRLRNGKVWLVNRDIGTSFGLRFLTDYLKFKYGA